MSYPPSVPFPRPRNWLERNLKWLIPALVLGLVTSLAGLALVFVSLLKGSSVYQGALGRIKPHPAVIAALGAPVREGFLFTGSIRIVNSSGEADLTIPLSGPKGEATAFVHATRSLGAWHYDRLIVETTPDQIRIDLSETSTQAPPVNNSKSTSSSDRGTL
ncbi:MAG: hypothetical protein RIQ79_2158 [Verrucomicrobiota bacterium]|jgi:hypothetical protein